jgi:hypothetical protein
VELLFNDLRIANRATDFSERVATVTLATEKLSKINRDLPAKLEESKEDLIASLHREWDLAISDIDELRIDTLEHITGERVAVIESVHSEMGIVLDRLTDERMAALQDIESLTVRISEEVAKEGTQAGERLIMKAFWMGVALAGIIFALVMVGAVVLRRGRAQEV